MDPSNACDTCGLPLGDRWRTLTCTTQEILGCPLWELTVCLACYTRYYAGLARIEWRRKMREAGDVRARTP